MKITELLNTPKKSPDTASSGTIYSIAPSTEAQDLVTQNNVPEKIVAEVVDGEILEMPDHSAITEGCLLYTSPSPRDRQKSRMPSSA